jgi:hypothetical protein
MPSPALLEDFKRLVADRDRLAAADGFLPERIGIARQLAGLDPADPAHRSDQARLEARWLEQAPEELEQAVASRDGATTALIATILANDGWVVAVPEQLRDRALAAGQQVAGAAILDQQAGLVAALGSPDPATVAEAWQELSATLLTAGLELSSLQDPRLAVAQARFQAQAKGRRKRTLILIGAIGGALILLGGGFGGWAWHRSARRQEAATLLRTLDDLMQSGAVTEADQRLTLVEQQDPGLITLAAERTARGQNDAIGRLHDWRLAVAERRKTLEARATALAKARPESLTEADLADLERLIDTADEQRRHAPLLDRIRQDIAENGRRATERQLDTVRDQLASDLAAIAAATDAESVDRISGTAIARLRQSLRGRLPDTLKSATNEALAQVGQATQHRIAQIKADQAAAAGLAKLAGDDLTLDEYLAGLATFARAHPEHPLATAYRSISPTQPALDQLLAWSKAWDGANGTIEGQAAAAASVLQRNPELANAAALRDLARLAGSGDTVSQLCRLLAGPWWTGWRELFIGGQRRLVPATWKLKKPAEFAGKIILEAPDLRSLNQLEGKSAIPNETLRLPTGTVINLSEDAPHATLAAGTIATLRSGPGGPSCILAAAAAVAKAKDLDPLFQAQSLRQILGLLTAEQRNLGPSEIRAAIRALDGLPAEPLWLRPGEDAACQAVIRARTALAGVPDLATAATAFAKQIAAIATAATPWSFAGRIVSGPDGQPALALRAGTPDGRLMACLGDGSRLRWIQLGNVVRGSAAPGVIPDRTPAGTPVLLAPPLP